MLARAALGYVIGLGGFLLFARFEAGVDRAGLLEEALAALPEDGRPAARGGARAAGGRDLPSSDVERRLWLSSEAVEMSRRLGDSEALMTALHARHWALGSPEMARSGSRTRARCSRWLETGNQEFAFLAHNIRFHCLLELCDGPAIDTEIAAIDRSRRPDRQPFYRWHGVCLQVIRAVLDGRFADAERLGRERVATSPVCATASTPPTSTSTRS